MKHPEQWTGCHNDKLIKQGEFVPGFFHAGDQVDDQWLEQVDQCKDVVTVEVLVFEEFLEGAHPEIGFECDEKEDTSMDEAVILAIALDQ